METDAITISGELEREILYRAVALYAGYTREMEQAMLLGDESDAEKVNRRANKAQSMAREMFEEYEGKKWEQASEEFHGRHGRPMDINDVSDFDWYEHVRGE